MPLYNFTKEEDGFDLLPTGDYEAEIERIEQRTLPSGKRKLSVQYRIRSDVEQAGKNRVIFEDIWAERDNPEVYNRKRLNKLMSTQDGIANGTEFDTIEDVIAALIGGQLTIHLVKELDEYKGEDVNRVAWYGHTKHGSQTLGSEPAKADAKEVEEFFADIDKCPF